MKRYEQHTHRPASDFKVGDLVIVCYLGWIVGLAGEEPVVRTIKSIGPKWIKTTDGFSAAADGEGWNGVIKPEDVRFEEVSS